MRRRGGSVFGGTLRGGNVSSSSWVAAVTAATAFSNASAVASEGFWTPLTLRTYWRAAASISSSVATGCSPRSVVMFRHMPPTVLVPAPPPVAARGPSGTTSGVLAAMAVAELLERLAVDIAGVGGGDPGVRHRPQRRGPETTFEQRPLPEDRTRADLCDRLAVDLDGQHTVEQQEDFVALLTLVRQHVAGAELADRRLRPAAHDPS